MMKIERHWEEHFAALYSGETTFGQFTAATLPLWRNLAAEIHRRWPASHWYSQADTVQELLNAAWLFTWKWEPRFGKTHRKYVVWNAYDKAKKAIHVARSAKRSGNADRAPGHIETPFSALGDADTSADGSAVDIASYRQGAYTAPDQERALVETEEGRERSSRAWAQADSFAEMHALEALAEADSLDDAARRIWEDVEVRVELRLRAPADAQRVVRQTARAVARRMGTAA